MNASIAHHFQNELGSCRQKSIAALGFLGLGIDAHLRLLFNHEVD